MVKRCDIRM